MATETELFSVKCVFRLEPSSDDDCKHLYEERITVWRAASAEEAIELAEQEAEKYVASWENPGKYIGYCMAYATYEPRFRKGMEVFSLIRESNLSPSKYLDRFYDTGKERAQSPELWSESD